MNRQSASPHQVFELLQRLVIFKGLGDALLKNLAAGTRLVSLAHGDTVFNKGEPAADLPILVSGQIRVFLPLASGAEKVVSSVSKGEAFCMAEACLGEHFPTYSVAIKKSHLLLIDRHVLLREAEQNGALAMRLIKELARLKLDLVSDLESCTPHSSLQRVACFLLQHRIDGQSSYDIQLQTTKRIIAAKLNVAQETLSRAFHQLTEDDIIAVDGRLIRVLDSQRLLAIKVGDCPKIHRKVD